MPETVHQRIIILQPAVHFPVADDPFLLPHDIHSFYSATPTHFFGIFHNLSHNVGKCSEL